ncbi:hypothetical protein HDU86_003567 [Geranomyces michiganensis]|nr:hypothetical protein HDU86_003567 [Geranomyces michiganensis]
MRTMSLFNEQDAGAPQVTLPGSASGPRSAFDFMYKQGSSQPPAVNRALQLPQRQSSRNLIPRQTSLPKLTLNVGPLNPVPDPPRSITSATASHPLPHASANETIQSMWASFDAMTDIQRNSLLKGIVKRCGENQVRSICTWLNLKMVEDDQGQMIHPDQPSAKYNAIPGLKPKRPKGNQDLLLTSTHSTDPSFFSALVKASATPQTPFTATPKKAPADDGSFARAGAAAAAGPTNINLYVKLLQEHSDMNKLALQLARSASRDPGTLAAFMSYLTRTVQTFRGVLSGMQSVAGSQDMEQVISKVFACASNAVDAQYASLYVVDETADAVFVRASDWLPVQLATNAGGGIPTPRLFGAGSLMKGEHLCICNVKTSDQFMEDLHPNYDKIDPECILSVPLVHHAGRVVAVLELINKRTQGATPFFNDQDEFVIKTIAALWSSMLAPLLISDQAVSSAGGHATADLRAIIDTASVMSGELDLGDLITTIMSTVQELLKAERVSLFIIDDVRQELWTTVAQGTQEIRIPINKGIAGYVATSGKTLNIPNVYKDPRFNREIDLKTGFHTRNILCMPMRNAQGGVMGVTQIINKLPDPTPFGKDDEMLLASFSALAGGMLDKTMVLKELQQKLTATQADLHALQSAWESSSVTILVLDAAGRLVTQTPHPTLVLPEAPIPQSTSYDTWLSPNQELIDDIAAVYANSKKGTRIVRVDELYYPDGAEDAVVVDYCVGPMADGTGVRVTLQLVDADVVKSRIIRRYYGSDETLKVISASAQKGVRGIASVLSAELPAVSAETTIPARQLLAELRTAISPLRAVTSKNDGIVITQTPSSSISVFHATPLLAPHEAVTGTPSPGTAARNAITAALAIRTALPRAAIVVCTGPTVSGLCGDEWMCVGDPMQRTKALHALSSVYTPPASMQSAVAEAPLILVDSQTADLVAGSFHIRELDAVEVNSEGSRAVTADGANRQTGQLVVVHQVLADGRTPLDQPVLTALICYELGLSDYRTQSFRAAIAHFEKAVSITADVPARVMMERCAAVMDGNVVIPEAWDGIWRWG